MHPLLRSISHLFFPVLCEGCKKPLLVSEKVLCVGCALRLPETNYHNVTGNDSELRFAGRVPFVASTSLAWFTNEGILQHLIHGLKYGNKKQNGIFLGSLLGQRLAGTAWAKGIDAIIPVPLHPAKEAKRGYNQSEVIARGMAAILGIPVWSHMLMRVRDTESQTRKSRSERVDNMAGAFLLKDTAALTGKHILLCDDVLTTGATLEACANALLLADSVKISLCTIGIAVS